MPDFETITKFESPITDSIYKKYKLISYNKIVHNIELARVDHVVCWEQAHYNFKAKLAETRVKTPREFAADWKEDYEMINEMFGFEPNDAKDLFLMFVDDMLNETKDMFIDTATKFLKDYINRNLEEHDNS